MTNSLRLVNFRNYVDTKLELAPKTVIVGPNGIGKSNIIEALFLLSTGRSWRTNRENELIRFGATFARVVAEPIELMILGGERTKKQAKVHGKSSRLLSLLGVSPSVLFSPNSLSLVDGSPALRRQFIDILLSQVSSIYAHNLLEYQRVVRQRNELLHQINAGNESDSSLTMWDEMLVTSSLPVLQARQAMAEQMRPALQKWYSKITPDGSDRLGVEYLSSVEKHHTGDIGSIETLFHDRLRDRKVAEIQAKRTLIGPHRDDFCVLLNKHPIGQYGSRGQARGAVVALKMFEFEYISQQSGTVPTLLFDDVFSEFDPYRRAAVADLADGAQIIFTATDAGQVVNMPKGVEVIDLVKVTKGEHG